MYLLLLVVCNFMCALFVTMLLTFSFHRLCHHRKSHNEEVSYSSELVDMFYLIVEAVEIRLIPLTLVCCQKKVIISKKIMMNRCV